MFAGLKVLDCTSDSAVAPCFLFCRDFPTNPFIARERRQILPCCLGRSFRAERHAQVNWCFVQMPRFVRFALVHHFTVPEATLDCNWPSDAS